jgi:hypothetical protein
MRGYSSEEPDAGKLQVRICGGGGGRPPPLPDRLARPLGEDVAKGRLFAERQERAECGPTVVASGTPAIDVNQTLGIAAVDVAAGGKTPVHLGAMASPRRRTARFAHASNALHPTLV